MSVWWRQCVFTRWDSRWVPTCYSQSLCLCLHSLPPSLFLPSTLSFWLSPFFRAAVRRPLLLRPLSFALHCSSFPPLSPCFLSEWYRRSVPQPHSSLWQPQPPDKRKQILQQEPDINGLSCFRFFFCFFFPCHVFSFILVFFLGCCSYANITSCESIKQSIRKTLQYCHFHWSPHSSLSLLPSLLGRMETSLDSVWLQTLEF